MLYVLAVSCPQARNEEHTCCNQPHVQFFRQTALTSWWDNGEKLRCRPRTDQVMKGYLFSRRLRELSFTGQRESSWATKVTRSCRKNILDKQEMSSLRNSISRVDMVRKMTCRMSLRITSRTTRIQVLFHRLKAIFKQLKPLKCLLRLFYVRVFNVYVFHACVKFISPITKTFFVVR